MLLGVGVGEEVIEGKASYINQLIYSNFINNRFLLKSLFLTFCVSSILGVATYTTHLNSMNVLSKNDMNSKLTFG